MRRSGERILTTHVGSLPALEADDLESAVAAIVAKQRELGLDLVNEGEYTKSGDWLSYGDDRFGGFEPSAAQGLPMIARGRDREEFADFYAYAARAGTLFYEAAQVAPPRTHWLCTGPIEYTGQEALQREIELLLEHVPAEDAFLTSTTPGSFEAYRSNEFYASQEEFLFAFGEALSVEYEQIAAAGVTLQVDDAWLPGMWDRIGIEMGIDAFRDYCRMRIDALNHALRNVPEERVRYHMCWGSWHGPHAFDIELRALADLLLEVKAQAYVIEGANARHEHEWAVWQEVALPDDKILVPGVVSHASDIVEHPDLVAQRLRRYVDLLGRERVVAGTDCGLGGRVHPQIAWAKLAALVEGAARV
jgi:5-methyltetrahydropteroyltriglutamate--homocysteine methyltransferase